MLSRIDDVSEYCPECLICISDGEESCPRCGFSDLRPLEISPHVYLGYLLDDRYRLDRYLGGGASGDVYRATDRKLDRPFALKIVELGGYQAAEEREEKVRRFENEVRALSRIQNPHVINIFESFELDDDVSALLMQYVDGVSLEGLLADGPIRLDRALTIIRQVANGLHEAHERGVIHRDVKPANIMIEKLPAAGIFARVLDFGLVHLVDDASQTRGFRGTPLYAAPEQCTSKLEVGRRADIYAVAAVLFHTLAGRPPFERESAVEIIEAHCKEPPPRLSEVVEGELPEQLVDLVDSALEKDPSNRPESFREFLRVLDSVGAQEHSYVGPDETGLGGGEIAPDPAETQGEISEVGPEISSTSSGLATAPTATSQETPAELLQSVELSEYLDTFAGGATAVRLGREGRGILLADGERRAHLISRGDRMYNDTFAGASMRLTGVAAQLTRGGIFGAEMNGRILRWRIDGRGEDPESVVQFSERILALDVQPRGTRLVAGSERGTILSYDARTGATKSHCRLDHPVCDLRLAAERAELVAATMTGDVFRVDVSGEGTEKEVLASVEREPGGIGVDEGNRWCAVLDRNGRIEVVHMHDPMQSFVVEPVPENLQSVSFSPNGQMLGVSVVEGMLHIWVFHHEPIGRRDALQG